MFKVLDAHQGKKRYQELMKSVEYIQCLNEPNSYEIEYHTGPRFNKTYEQAASYLNLMMPAVILNQSQLSKIQSIMQEKDG